MLLFGGRRRIAHNISGFEKSLSILFLFNIESDLGEATARNETLKPVLVALTERRTRDSATVLLKVEIPKSWRAKIYIFYYVHIN